MTAEAKSPDMDAAFEALALRNAELEDEKHRHLELIDEQMRAMVRQKKENVELRSALAALLKEAEAFANSIPAYQNSEAINHARRIIEQTKSEGE